MVVTGKQQRSGIAQAEAINKAGAAESRFPSSGDEWLVDADRLLLGDRRWSAGGIMWREDEDCAVRGSLSL